MNTFTPEQIKILQDQGFFLQKPIQLVEEDYTSDCDSDSDSGCESPQVKRRGRGRPKKVRSPEEIAAREASKARGRGRPKIERTPEQLADIAAAIVAKEVRAKDRETKKVERESSDAMKKKLRLERQDKIEQKAIEQTEREILAKGKRTEIYNNMIAKAEAYKAKWSL